MKIINNKKDVNIIINNIHTNKIDLGWEETFKEYEENVFKEIINPLNNYEMSLFKFNNYLIDDKYKINDLHFSFYFKKNQYLNNYENIDFLNKDIFVNADYFVKSFFRIEYYKVINDIKPNKLNRRLVSTKVLNLNDGELFLDTSFNEMIYKPYFISSNNKNKSINNFYWFEDKTLFENLDYKTFWISVKFFNSKNGIVYDFTNKEISSEINETDDIYYKMILNDNYTYNFFDTNDNLIGNKLSPIKFYQKNG